VRQGIPYDDEVVSHLLGRWYEPHGRELRGCHPRDIVEAIVDAGRYDDTTPELSAERVDEVCATYFLTPLNAPI
jgi:hypothetical protein